MDNITNALAWTILHSIWQGSIIYLVLIIWMAIKRDLRPSSKYLIILIAALVFAGSSATTFFLYYNVAGGWTEKIGQEVIPIILVDTIEPLPQSLWSRLQEWVNSNKEQMVSIWSIGATLFLFKTLISIVYLYIKEKKASTIDIEKYGINFVQILKKMQIKRPVSLKILNQSVSPYTTGVIKPVIFFPMAVLNHLCPEEVEAILVHELAHIQRHDYFINLAMVILESVYFYHPFVWWLNAHLHDSREESCDEVVLNFGIPPVTYANALYKIEALISNESETFTSLKMAAIAANNKKQIMNRIKRIFNMTTNHNSLKEKLAASLFILLIAFGVNQVHAKKAIEKPALIESTRTELSIIPSDTIKPKQKSSYTIYKSEGDKNIELKMEDGEITSLKIDDKNIDKSDYIKYQDIIDEAKPMSEDKVFGMKLEGQHPRIIIDGNSIDMSQFEGRMNDISKQIERSFGENGERIKIYTDRLEDNWQDMFGRLQNRHSKDSTGRRSNFAFGFDMDSLVQFHFGKLIDSNFMKSMKRFNIEDFGDLRNFDHEFNEDNLNVDDMLGQLKRRSGGVQEALIQQLNADGINTKTKDIEIEISDKGLKIDGETQPANMHTKYKRLIEIETGLEIEEGTKLNYKVTSKEKRKIIRG